MVRNLLPKPKKKGDEAKDGAGTFPLSLAGVPEEWIAHPKQVGNIVLVWVGSVREKCREGWILFSLLFKKSMIIVLETL